MMRSATRQTPSKLLSPSSSAKNLPLTRDNESASRTRADERDADERDGIAQRELENAPSAPDTAQASRQMLPQNLPARLARRGWLIVAASCLLAAALLLIREYIDAAFVVATIGVLAWFFDLRNRLRPPDIEADDRIADEIEDGDENFNDPDKT